MAVDDRTRLNLHRKLTEVLGSEEADTLMAHLPPVTWDQVTTKDDLAALRVGTRSDLKVVEVTLRSEMKEMETGIRSDMQSMESGLRSDMQAMESGLRSDVQRLEIRVLEALVRQTKWVITAGAAWSAILITAVRLIP